MRIESLEFTDASENWKLSATTFCTDLTLFVGPSAVDKWQLLAAIDTLARFARGEMPETMWGVGWKMHFTVDGRNCQWVGKVSGRRFSFRQAFRPDSLLKLLPRGMHRNLSPTVLHEVLIVDGREVFGLRDNTFRLRGQTLRGVSPSRSALNITRQDAEVPAIRDHFSRILFGEEAADTFAALGKRLQDLCKDYPTISAVRNSRLPTYHKLATVHEIAPAFFAKIVQSVRERFPQIADIGFDRLTRGRFTDVPALRVLEHGTDQWQSELGGTSGLTISSERLQAVLNLASVALWPDHAVILIDDFETNLGTYCLEPVMAAAADRDRNLQVILTSADPDVMQRIGRDRRKVVLWQGSIITTDDDPEHSAQQARGTGISLAPGIVERWQQAHSRTAITTGRATESRAT
jgi:hypothetical protein